jgi:hypothetical protein
LALAPHGFTDVENKIIKSEVEATLSVRLLLFPHILLDFNAVIIH